MKLFAPKKTVRLAGGGFGGGRGGPPDTGQNPPAGVVVNYFLSAKPTEVKLRFTDSSGKLINEFSSKAPPAPAHEPGVEDDPRDRTPLAPAMAGMNRFVWNMRYKDAIGFPGLLMWAASLRGPLAVPGHYKVELIVDGKPLSEPFEIIKDPRAPTTTEDFQKQLDLSLKVLAKFNEANRSVITIREAKKQMEPYTTSTDAKVSAKAKAILDEMSVVENNIYQTKLQADEDALNFPIKLNNKLGALLGVVQGTDVAPTSQSYEVFDDLSAKLKVETDRLHQIETTEIATFNQLVESEKIPAVTLKQP
jgi:hypothetical protein